ncbi:MAG: sigma-70 family RNA polymerase sigma factor [Candidatus Metalachnospira sp.]|nr:sigma-70 family RNA polymerase sigma factor [Candidatus Metalachnospira sp.]
MNTDELFKLTSLYGKDLFSFCLYLTQSKYEADELYQDAFLKAYEMSDKIFENSNLKSFLIGIAIRLWKNKKRKSAWRNRIAPKDSLDDAGGVEYDGMGPDKILMAAEEKDAVRSAVNSLNDKFKIPILLYYSMDMSVEKISELLKIPQGTVKSRLYNARKILKEKLEADIYG